MQEIHLTTREAIIYLTLIGIAGGFLMGLVPLIYGWVKGKRKLGVTGMLVSTAAGAVWIVLPLLSMIVFVFLIARRSPLNSTSEDDRVASADDDSESVL